MDETHPSGRGRFIAPFLRVGTLPRLALFKGLNVRGDY